MKDYFDTLGRVIEAGDLIFTDEGDKQMKMLSAVVIDDDGDLAARVLVQLNEDTLCFEALSKEEQDNYRPLKLAYFQKSRNSDTRMKATYIAGIEAIHPERATLDFVVHNYDNVCSDLGVFVEKNIDRFRIRKAA